MDAMDMLDLGADAPPARNQGSAGTKPGGYRVVSVRLREAEFMSFSAQARAVGLTHNLALRIAARRIAGFLEIDAETRMLLRQITDEIGDIAEGLIQLNRIAVRDTSLDLAKFSEYRMAFGREFAQLDTQLQTILNVSQRRQDGRALLKNAVS